MNLALKIFWKVLCLSQAALLFYAVTMTQETWGQIVVGALATVMLLFAIFTELDV